MGKRVEFVVLDRTGKTIKEGFYTLNNLSQRKRFGGLVAEELYKGNIIVSGLSTLPPISIGTRQHVETQKV